MAAGGVHKPPAGGKRVTIGSAAALNKQRKQAQVAELATAARKGQALKAAHKQRGQGLKLPAPVRRKT